MKTLLDYFNEHIESISEDEFQAEWEQIASPQKPKGWLSIDDYQLPTDLCSSYFGDANIIKVRLNTGEEIEKDFPFCDPNVCTIMAKEIGITHWFND